ncbi:MAG TPA: hypothetical protein VJB98_02110 [Candidatus Paceibacterota bacterium]
MNSSRKYNSGQALRRNSGQAVIVSVMFLLLVSTVVVARGANPASADSELARELLDSKRSAILAESGAEDVTYRVRSAQSYDNIEVISLDGFYATTTVTDDVDTGVKTVESEGNIKGAIRQKLVELQKGDEVDFNYGVQAGNGGFLMFNSASVVGNIYSNGSVTGAGNLVQGSVVSATSTGLVDDIHATSSVWSHTINDSTIDGDAYYVVKTDTSVAGNSYPNSVDKPTTTFPLSEAQLDEWEAVAEAGGVISSPCPYKITTDTTIGPKKINCDLEISNNAVVTLSGMIWINGNLTIKNSSGIYLDESLTNKSIALIAHNLSDETTSSKISLENTTTFYNTNTPGSFLFLISRNRSSADGGAAIAIELKNTASGPVFLYTNYGMIDIGNNTKLKAVTGYLISMKNFSRLQYEDGLESTLFDTGPGGSWNVVSWKETQ